MEVLQSDSIFWRLPATAMGWRWAVDHEDCLMRRRATDSSTLVVHYGSYGNPVNLSRCESSVPASPAAAAALP